MGNIIASIFSAVFKGIFSMFLKTPEERLGIEETENAASKKENAGLAQALAAGDRVDRDTDPDKLLDNLNKRP
jgi:hypothetical protein